MKANFNGFFEALAEACKEYNERQEEERARRRGEFEDNSERKVFNRGTVISAMAKRGWASYKMDRVLNAVSNSEQAEAAVGLIETGKYDCYEIAHIIKKL